MRSEALTHERLVLPFMAPLYARLSPLMEPLVRATAGLLLVPHGAQKLFGAFGGGGLTATGEFLGSIGYTPGWFWALALACLEFFGGIMLALGLFTRLVAAAVVVFMLNAIAVHWGSGFFWNQGGFEYPLFWGIVALAFVVRGGGPYSLDARLGREV